MRTARTSCTHWSPTSLSPPSKSSLPSMLTKKSKNGCRRSFCFLLCWINRKSLLIHRYFYVFFPQFYCDFFLSDILVLSQDFSSKADCPCSMLECVFSICSVALLMLLSSVDTSSFTWLFLPNTKNLLCKVDPCLVSWELFLLRAIKTRLWTR